MKLINTNSLGGTCDRCGKGIVNVAVFEGDGEHMEVGLDCAYKLTSDDFPTARAIKAEMKAAREIAAFKRALAKNDYFVRAISEGENRPVYWSSGNCSHHAGYSMEKLTGLRLEYRDLVLSYAGKSSFALA